MVPNRAERLIFIAKLPITEITGNQMCQRTAKLFMEDFLQNDFS